MDLERNLHVFDLPQLYTKPPATSLLAALSLLVVQPRSWSPTNRSERRQFANDPPTPRIHPEGVTDYLTKIIASPLAWIPEVDVRETVWEAASLRLSERSGRSAMSAMERSFSVPRCISGEEVELLIHEPALTADSLGFKTWAASYLLAKRLPTLAFPSLRRDDRTSGLQYHVLELGAGTGLVGMAAAAVLSTGVLLTDLPEIAANLARNVEANRKVLTVNGGFAATATLDWATPLALSPSSNVQVSDAWGRDNHSLRDQSSTGPDFGSATPTVLPDSYPIVVAADCIYDSAHPAMLVSTIKTWLSRSEDARVVIELPLRDAYMGDIEALRKGMSNSALNLLDEGYETGVDDWGDENDLRDVKCWWGVWGWARDAI